MATDEELMNAYVAGDHAAFDTLYLRYATLLTRVAARKLGSLTQAQDLVQQTFLQLHRARFDFDPRARFRPWLFTIAFNLQREVLRKRLRRPEVPLEPELVRAAERHNSDVRDVRAALATLPPETREVITLHWLDGLPFSDVAALVGASVSAVKVRAHRGYALLKCRLEEET